MEDLLSRDELPDGFDYPLELKTRVLEQLLDVGPAWQLLTGKWLRVRDIGLKQRFPERRLVPFARNLGTDDIACWDLHDSHRICIVHDFSAPGWERRESYDSFAHWLDAATNESDGDVE